MHEKQYGHWYSKGYIDGASRIEEVYDALRTKIEVELIEQEDEQAKESYVQGFFDAAKNRLGDLFSILKDSDKVMIFHFNGNEEEDDE